MKKQIIKNSSGANFNVLQGENTWSSNRLGLLAIIFGCCIAVTFLSLKYSGKKTDFEDAATFGAGTSSIMASIDGRRIHCMDSRDADECIAGAKDRHAVASVLWLGNSQVHAVNQLKAGETNSTPRLFNQLKEENLDLVTFSQPNANLQEHLVLFEYIKRQLPLKLLILPVVFDDMREDGLRKEISDFLSDVQVNKALSETAIGLKLLKANKFERDDKNDDTAGISFTIQEKVERVLNTWLTESSTLWAARPEIRGQLLSNLFILRNTVLGIKPTSKRKVIRGRYQDNFLALEAILTSAANDGIAVVLYVVPIRSDVEVPYVTGEYSQYKAEIQSLANSYRASFFNLENLVPSELWGVKESITGGEGLEIDFMHFQAGGHELLADRLAALVRSIWAKQGLRN
jgi:hypothetical protein